MKKISILFFLASLFIIGIGCSEEKELTALVANGPYEITDITDITEPTPETCNPTPIDNQLVVKYARPFSEDRKAEIREAYDVQNFKKCECADPTLELWDFGYDGEGNAVNIEQKKALTEDDPDLEETERNFIMRTTGTASYYAGETPSSFTFSSTGALLSNNKGVSIAILDTGLQLDYVDGDNDSYLYNSAANDFGCGDVEEPEISGWDFVNQDNTPSDDNGHGTIVTGLIAKSLNKLELPYNVLPVKVFDAAGKGTYFDVLCGYQFAAKKPGMDIINMSFGWCSDAENGYQLLSRFISATEAAGKIVLVASSGNKGFDNDLLTHYPSSYPQGNLLSIASMNEPLTGLADFSNYGQQSVDFAAVGENIPFKFTNEPIQLVSGTSYAAAHISAYVAYLLTKGVPVANITSEIQNHAIPLSTLGSIQYGTYIPEQ